MDLEKHKRIERRAYAFWQAEGQPHGRHDEHWHRAAWQIDAEEAEQVPQKRKERRGSANSGRKKKRRDETAPLPRRTGTVLVAKITRSGPSRCAQGPIRAGIAGSHPDLTPGPALAPAQPQGS
jgi:DUF2934 family protein